MLHRYFCVHPFEFVTEYQSFVTLYYEINDFGLMFYFVGKKKSKPVPEELPREVNPWDKVRFSVTDLTGHNDIVCSVHCYKDLVVSGR